MLPLALKDLFSLCNMPFVINSHGKISLGRILRNQKDNIRYDTRVEKSAFREWEVVSVGAFYVNADMGCTDRTW